MEAKSDKSALNMLQGLAKHSHLEISIQFILYYVIPMSGLLYMESWAQKANLVG